MKAFLKQFGSNIDFHYSCFDRVVIRGYILKLFTTGGIIILLRALGFYLIVPDLGEILRWVGKNSLDGFLRMMEKQTVGELLVS